ncbi:aspartate racemase [Oceanobacillus limi]|uniref:Aspartate racemase n=1 Tax=Oceanobacillus limi TaxID=930131 RepID=A0A1I0H9N8_9BACI|nr:amino acid racemase [Oceanobacillus limi]SET80481.1 aspartate racemase [Oceanobacillus limi]
MTKKKLGILGGMGPKATSVFFEKIISNTVAHKDQDHLDMVILNHASLPDRTVSILENKKQEFLDAVRQDFMLFDQSGVSNIAIPCNTSHYLIEEMQSMTDINIINMVQGTVEYIRDKFGEHRKVAILATDGTIQSGVYENECKKHGIEPFVPNKELQQKVMQTIYKIKSDVDFKASEFESIINEVITKENCTDVILGCTELSCIDISEELKSYCVDPMDILVRLSITLSGKTTI